MAVKLDNSGRGPNAKYGTTDVYFNDDEQTVVTEEWGTDGYITFNRETVEDEAEYFKRKLAGK